MVDKNIELLSLIPQCGKLDKYVAAEACADDNGTTPVAPPPIVMKKQVIRLISKSA